MTTATSGAGSAHNATVRTEPRVPVPDPDSSDESQAEQPDSNPEE